MLGKNLIAAATGDAVVGWDLTNASFITSFSTAAEGKAYGLWMDTTGTRLFSADPANNNIHAYTLSAPLNLGTASFSQSYSVLAQGGGARDLCFKDDGSKMYVLESVSDTIDEYNLSSAWDISTASYLQEFDITSQDITPHGLFIRQGGAKMYVSGNQNDNVYEYTLTTPWDITSSVYVQSYSVAARAATPANLSFSPDGSIMFLVATNRGTIERYDLSTPWDISTASNVQFLSVGAQAQTPLGLYVVPQGNRLFVSGFGNNVIASYTL